MTIFSKIAAGEIPVAEITIPRGTIKLRIDKISIDA